ncbi:MAG: MFS transporter, partial [Gammaproteobacteria bacterium]|nr:MFS transporter [Gammaproteobacteria bacterium]
MQSSQPLYRLNVKKPNIVSLILLTSFATMGVIMITPALPAISLDYNASKTTVQFGITLFLLGYAIGQLIFGPVANRYGRKPALYVGLLTACLGSVLTITANIIHYHPLFVAGRFIEALGSSCGLVLSFAIVNDFYFLEQARKLSALLILAFAIMPSIAIALGGLITFYLGWKFCFYFLLAYGITLFYFVARLPETLTTTDPQALHYKYFFNKYLATIKNRNLVTYAVIYGLSTGCAYSFSTEGPFIGIHL